VSQRLVALAGPVSRRRRIPQIAGQPAYGLDPAGLVTLQPFPPAIVKRPRGRPGPIRSTIHAGGGRRIGGRIEALAIAAGAGRPVVSPTSSRRRVAAGRPRYPTEGAFRLIDTVGESVSCLRIRTTDAAAAAVRGPAPRRHWPRV
jgi:hypothetical protein